MSRRDREARCDAEAARGEAGLGLPLAMAVKQQPELSIPSPIRRKPSEVKLPPHTVAGVEQSIYRKGCEQAIQSEFERHMKTGTFSVVDKVPEGRKPVGSKLSGVSTLKQTRMERSPSSKRGWLPGDSRRDP